MNSSITDNWTSSNLIYNLVNSSALNNSIDTVTRALSYCAYFIAYYFCLKIAIVLLRALWRLKDDIYGIRSRLPPSADKVILITGGTSGIGLALAKYFYKRGFSIIATRHSRAIPDELIELQKCSIEVVIDKPKMFFIHLDVTSQDSIANSYTEVKEILAKDKLDLYALINNAGLAYYCPAFWMTREQITALNATNFLGSILMVRQYMPLLIKTPNSRVIHVGSSLSFIPIRKCATYVATKAGMSIFMNALALELKSYSVRAITVHVGDHIQTTSVLSNCKKDLEKVYSEFSFEEKQIYGGQLETHAEKLNSIENWVNNTTVKGTKNNSNFIRRILLKLIKFFGGEQDSNVKIEDSYSMKSFDNAVCMTNPNSEFFAGSWFFTYFSGAVFESLDSVDKRLFGYLASKTRLDEHFLGP